jgi:putative exporter of polyketide antibiotics
MNKLASVVKAAKKVYKLREKPEKGSIMKWLCGQERAAKIAWSLVLGLASFLGYNITVDKNAEKLSTAEQKLDRAVQVISILSSMK